jgi:hypothetical protein
MPGQMGRWQKPGARLWLDVITERAAAGSRQFVRRELNELKEPELRSLAYLLILNRANEQKVKAAPNRGVIRRDDRLISGPH